MADKHNSFFELRDALARQGCAICRLSARSVRRYLEALSFESVNDLGIRERLRRARGFCNLHAWVLLDEVRDPFGTAIIYRDVLRECARIVERGELAVLESRAACPGCETRAESSARYLDVLLEHVHEKAIGDRVVASGGLCWRHFALAVARGSRGLRALADAEVSAIEALAQPVTSASQSTSRVPTAGVRAGNVAPRPSPDDDVGDRLVATAVGLRGVFGPSGESLQSAGGTDDLGFAAPAATGDGCSICTVAVEGVRQIALTARVEDGTAPMCTPHAWLLVDVAGAPAARAVLAPALDDLREHIVAADAAFTRAQSIGFGPISIATPAARQTRGDLAAQLTPGKGCTVCRTQASLEERALEHTPTDAPLCRPHLTLSHRSGTPRSATPTLEAWRPILADLDEYIRKNDYRFREEARGVEQTSPWRAVAAVAAAKGVR